jgi:hypothetical protein
MGAEGTKVGRLRDQAPGDARERRGLRDNGPAAGDSAQAAGEGEGERERGGVAASMRLAGAGGAPDAPPPAQDGAPGRSCELVHVPDGARCGSELALFEGHDSFGMSPAPGFEDATAVGALLAARRAPGAPFPAADAFRAWEALCAAPAPGSALWLSREFNLSIPRGACRLPAIAPGPEAGPCHHEAGSSQLCLARPAGPRAGRAHAEGAAGGAGAPQGAGRVGYGELARALWRLRARRFHAAAAARRLHAAAARLARARTGQGLAGEGERGAPGGGAGAGGRGRGRRGFVRQFRRRMR